MMENMKKHLRTLYRDYWNRDLQPGEKMPLKLELILSAGLVLAATAGLSFFLPALAAPLLVLTGIAVPTVFTMQLRKIREETQEFSSVELELTGRDTRGTLTLSGPGHAVNVVANTQAMLYRKTRPGFSILRTPAYNEIPQKLLRKLAPHFNDCAEAAAQLEARVDGKPVDAFAIGHYCMGYDNNGGSTYWYEAVKLLLTAQGAAKKLSADNLQAGAAAASQVTDGIAQRLTVKPIRLKVKA